MLVVFFVTVGTSLRLDALETGRASSPWRSSSIRLALIRLGVRLGTARLGLDPDAGEYRVDRADFAGRHHARASRRCSPTEFPTWGSAFQTLLVALIAIDELIGPGAFRSGSPAPESSTPQVPRPLIVVSNREPYLHTTTRDGHD